MTLDTDHANGNDMVNGNDQMLTNEIDEMSAVLANNDRQQPWFQDTWSLPFPPAPLNTSFSSDLHAGGLAQSATDPDERGRIDGAFSAAAPEDTSFLPAANGPQVEGFSSASSHDVDQGDRTVSSLASQSPAYSRSFQEDHATGLHDSLNKESVATMRLIQLYFAEVHPYWPILHAPTFDTANASHVLLGSMILLTSWLEGELDHVKLAPLVFDAVTAALLVRHCFPFGLIEND